MEIEIRIRRIYDPPTDDDGFRVLVNRLWPRGVSKQAACIGLWAKELAPSTALRQQFHADRSQFDQFQRDYLRELDEKRPAVAAVMEQIPGSVVTLRVRRPVPHGTRLTLFVPFGASHTCIHCVHPREDA